MDDAGLHLPSTLLERWFDLIPEDRPDLRDAGLYLYLGPGRYRLLHYPEPVALLEHARFLRDTDDEIYDEIRLLLGLFRRGRQVLLELTVDQLLVHQEWSHPTQVLERPRPRFDALLSICKKRLEESPGDDALEHAIQRLDIAISVSEIARERVRGRTRPRQRSRRTTG